jgi:hypothetical protein
MRSAQRGTEKGAIIVCFKQPIRSEREKLKLRITGAFVIPSQENYNAVSTDEIQYYPDIYLEG